MFWVYVNLKYSEETYTRILMDAFENLYVVLKNLYL